MSRLSRSDWNSLDELLGKHGFGGYYDLVATLTMVLGNLGYGNTGIIIDGEGSKSMSLPEVVSELSDWSITLCHIKGFNEVSELAAEEVRKEK